MMRFSVRAAYPLAALFLNHFVLADDLLFSPACDDTWQGCCPLGADHMQNNWGRTSLAPICPQLPTLSDTVTIMSDCVVATPPGSTAQIINQSNGTFTINGPLSIGQQATFAGPIVWNSGEIARGGAAAGQFAVANGGVTIQGDTDKTLSFFGGFMLSNAGVGSWSGAGNWTIGMIPGACCPSIFRNEVGATFSVLNNSSILSTSFGIGRFENAGTLIKDLSTGTSTWSANLSNSGLVHIKTGVLRLTAGGGVIGGTWNMDPGAEFQIAGNFSTLDPGVTINGRAVVLDSGTNPGIVVNENTTIDDLTIAPTGITGGNATLSFRGTLNVEGGIPSTPIVILPGADLQSQGSQRFVALTIQGTAHLNAGATGSFGGVLTVTPGGEVIIADGATLGNSSLTVQPIQNNGLIRKNATPGTATILSAFNQNLFNNAGGLIDVPAGVMECGCKLEAASEIHVGPGALFHQATWANYRAGASFTGPGAVLLDSQNNAVEAGYELPVTNLIIAGDVTGGGLGGPGRLRVSQSLELRGGYCTAPTTIMAGATLRVVGPNFTGTETWENYGTATVIAGGMNYFNPFNNHAGAVVDIQNDVSFGGRFGNGVFNNLGLLKKTGGSGDATMLGTLNNANTVELRSGRLAVNTFNQSAGSTLFAGGGVYGTTMTLTGGAVTGAGTIASYFTNTSGVIAPGAPIGTLNVTAGLNTAGDYTQAAGGSLRIDIGGAPAGTQYDRLAVERNASLSGGLNLALANGYMPNVGDSFTILTTGGTRTGTFSRVSGVQIGGGKRFSVQYDTHSVTVTVTSNGTTPGDLDGDGHVSLQDLATLLGSFGTCDGDAAFAAAADINGDGCVSIADLAILLGSFGI